MKTLDHIAVICDGNRRWARRKGLKVFFGHQAAVDGVFEPLISHAADKGISFLTFWIFSTENWKREKTEVDYLMNLFRKYFDEKIETLDENNVKINMIGDIHGFDQDIQDRILRAMEKTKNNTGITVTLAMNYGGRDELTRAMQSIAEDVQQQRLQPSEVTAEYIEQKLDTQSIPDPDLIVRTSGEQRMSGFLLWQLEYAEFYFPEWDFPDFSPEKLDECIAEFHRRQRRFGGG